MTIWSDYQPAPGDNNSPPPVGAPEGMPPSSVNDCMREMMSVIRQLGDQVSGTFAGLGSMANQNANAVNITGGTLTGVGIAGNGGGITNLTAANLNGIIPSGNLSGYYNIRSNQANTADALGGIPLNSLVPLGAIIMFYGDIASVDATIWAVCDGTRGTPDMRFRHPRGAGSNADLTYSGSFTGTTDAVGAHAHTGATAGYTLTIADMPAHTHNTSINWYGGGGGNPGFIGQGSGPSGTDVFPSDSTGGGQAHAHGIQADGGHAHTFAFYPPAFGLWFLMRVA